MRPASWIRSSRLGLRGGLRIFGGLASSGFFLLLLRQDGALVELVNATGGIDQLLLTGEERMASRADLDRDRFQGRAGRKGAAARAMHVGFGVPGGVDLVFHSHTIIPALARGASLLPKRHGPGASMAWMAAAGRTRTLRRSRPLLVHDRRWRAAPAPEALMRDTLHRSR